MWDKDILCIFEFAFVIPNIQYFTISDKVALFRNDIFNLVVTNRYFLLLQINPPEPNESSGGYFFSFSALIIEKRICFCTNEIHNKVDFQQADGTFQERLFF